MPLRKLVNKSPAEVFASELQEPELFEECSQESLVCQDPSPTPVCRAMGMACSPRAPGDRILSLREPLRVCNLPNTAGQTSQKVTTSELKSLTSLTKVTKLGPSVQGHVRKGLAQEHVSLEV